MGVAVAADGTVYVADAGAQRIRAIRDGNVSTVAGSATKTARGGLWFLGGFGNGAASEAQFNNPTGVAVDSQGRIYVADSNNHCIRLIEHGVVTTYAGEPTQVGSSDGPPSNARFDRPISVAVDPKGGLYVADYGNGVRHIDAAGTVTTVIATKTATGVTVSPGVNHLVYAADRNSLRVLRSGVMVAIPSAGYREKGSAAPAMDADVGHPFMVTAADDERVFFTDEETGAVRYLDVYDGTVRLVVGPRYEDASNDAAAFRDGPASQAEVNDAAGVSFDDRGRLLLADAGNRRLRLISGLDLRPALMPNIDLIPAQTAPQAGFASQSSAVRSSGRIRFGTRRSSARSRTGWTEPGERCGCSRYACKAPRCTIRSPTSTKCCRRRTEPISWCWS
jgi:sugar lactone lactonase YvrE